MKILEVPPHVSEAVLEKMKKESIESEYGFVEAEGKKLPALIIKDMNLSKLGDLDFESWFEAYNDGGILIFTVLHVEFKPDLLELRFGIDELKTDKNKRRYWMKALKMSNGEMAISNKKQDDLTALALTGIQQDYPDHILSGAFKNG